MQTSPRKKFKTKHPCLYISIIFFAGWIALILVSVITLGLLNIKEISESIRASIIDIYLTIYLVHIAIVCKEKANYNKQNGRKIRSILWKTMLIIMIVFSAIIVIFGAISIYQYEMGWVEHLI